MAMTYPAKTIYLAGPITGVSYGEARDGWRNEFARILHEPDPEGKGFKIPRNDHIHCISPMRGERLMAKSKVVPAGAEYHSDHHIENPKGILTRDANDVAHCDLIVANFLGATRPSIGTCAEFGMAYILRKPVVLIMENDFSNPHHHAFITEIATYWVDSLEKAADIATVLLTPGL
jgi:nucleoside 2-deoxyribosyltransferase